MKHFLKILRNSLLTLIGLVLLLVLLINYGPIQNYITQKAVVYLSKKLNTEVQLQNLKFKLFNKLSLQGLYIPTPQQDTLLYIGALDVDISDWFFMKKKPAVHYISLQNSIVHLERPKTSDVWNYQFVINAFSNNENKNNDNNTDLPNFDIKEIELSNVRFLHLDKWIGTDYEASVGTLKLNAEKVDLKKGKIDVTKIIGDAVLLGITEYKGGRPPRKRSDNPYPLDTTPFNPQLWKFNVQELALQNSRFFLEYPEYNTPEGLFDELHLNITGINTNITNINIEGDTIKGHVNNLNAKERCGIVVHKMVADVTVSPVMSECKNLRLETANSILQDYYAMRYTRFPDFINYISEVVMEGKFNNASIGIDDIIYFAPEMQWAEHKNILLNGNASGTVAAFRTQNISANDGINKFTGDIAITGLPNVEDTYLDWQQGTVQGSGDGLLAYIPSLKEDESINLSALGKINFAGNAHGFLNNFYLNGNLVTELGNAEFITNFIAITENTPQYKGDVKFQNFYLGKLLNQPDIEYINLETIVNGKGFSTEDFEMVLEGKSDAFMFKNYEYNHLSFEGTYNQQGYDGKLISRDENLSFDLNGKFRLGTKQNTFNCAANLLHINTKNIGLTNNTIEGNAILRLNFSGLSVDEFNGNIAIDRINLIENNTPISLSGLDINANVFEDGFRKILLQTNGVYAQAEGKFSITELPNAFYSLLAVYIPEFIAAPQNYNPNQDVHFVLKTESTDDIFRLLNVPLRLSSDIDLEGRYQGTTQQLSVKGSIPWIRYNQLFFDNISLKISGESEGLNSSISVQKFNVDDYLVFEDALLASNVLSNLATFRLSTGASGNINTTVITGNTLAANDSFYVSILESGFYFNRKHWLVNSGNNFVFAKDYIDVQNLTLQSDAQKIFVNKNNSVPNKLNIDISQIEINPLNNMLDLTDGLIKGKVNGNIIITPLLENQQFNFDVNTTDLYYNEMPMGKINVIGNVDIANTTLSLNNGTRLMYDGSGIEATGGWNWSNNHFYESKIRLKDAPLTLLQPVLEGYCKEVSGTVSGYLNMDDKNSQNTYVNGGLNLNNASATADINGVTYQIAKGNITINNKHFELQEMLVNDLDGNTGLLSGNVVHNGLEKLNFNLKFNSDKIKVLHLSKPYGEYFYGRVWADVTMNLKGDVDNLNMDLIMLPKSQSQLFIPIVTGNDLSRYDYIQFKQKGDTKTPIRSNLAKNKFNIRIEAIANTDLESFIILDEATGDQIQARGTGNIIMEIPSDGDFRLNGNYFIEEGKYNFAFKQLEVLNYRKEFMIEKGSAIKWNGSMYNADLDVAANTQIKARLYDLIANEQERIALTDQELYDAQLMQLINLQMQMNGSLETPELNFKIGLVESRSVGTYAYQKLQRINANERELLNQVAGLLLVGQFLPPEGLSGGATNATISAGAITNMSEVFSTVASSQISNMANKALGIEDLYIGLRYKNYALTGYDQSDPSAYLNRNEAGFNVRKNFFSNRLIAEVGGVYDWGRPSSAQGDIDSRLAGDFRVQYLLSKDGNVRMSIFRNSNYDAIFQQTIGRQGAGLTYRKSFNNLNDWFVKKNKEINDSVNAEKADSAR